MAQFEGSDSDGGKAEGCQVTEKQHEAQGCKDRYEPETGRIALAQIGPKIDQRQTDTETEAQEAELEWPAVA